MASIRLEDVHKVYPNGHVASAGVELEVADGEFMVLVGPSGSGKSTVLRMVAGLETPTRGRILLDDDDVTQVPPQHRDLAMVFQNYALYPHMTVRENMEFGLRMRRVPKHVIAERVAAAARKLGLEEYLDRKPAQLSGGQRQRVALGRAIVREPRAFLFDEPLSNLDAKLRVQTRAELARIHRELGATMLYVTHDQEEAMTLGDRIAVMNEGRLQQVAPPLEVYRRPANVFVAGFVGSPAMNFFRCTLETGEDGAPCLACDGFALPLAGIALEREPAGRELLLGVRPQDLEVVAPEGADLTARVDVVEPLGSELLVHLARPGAMRDRELVLVTSAEAELAEGMEVGLRLRRERLHLFDAVDGARVNR
jgi:multiple sugar transport system ATP-binding protein